MILRCKSFQFFSFQLLLLAWVLLLRMSRNAVVYFTDFFNNFLAKELKHGSAITSCQLRCVVMLASPHDDAAMMPQSQTASFPLEHFWFKTNARQSCESQSPPASQLCDGCRRQVCNYEPADASLLQNFRCFDPDLEKSHLDGDAASLDT